MERINTPTANPNANGQGKAGFVEGDAQGGLLPTRLNARWCNSVQEEIASVIEGQGLDLDGNDRGQLYNAILLSAAKGGESLSFDGIQAALGRNGGTRPDFIRPAVSANRATVLASAANPLVLRAGGLTETLREETILSDLAFGYTTNDGRATLALPTGTSLFERTGEIGHVEYDSIPDGEIHLTAVGPEFAKRLGKLCAFRLSRVAPGIGTISDFFIGRIASVGSTRTVINDIYRRYFLDNNGDPLAQLRGSVSDIQIRMVELVTVFRDLTHKEYVTLTPNQITDSETAPSNPADGDMWFNYRTRTWSRYSTADSRFNEVAAVMLGHLVLNDQGGNCVGARSFDLGRNYSRYNDVALENEPSLFRLKNQGASVSVYGVNHQFLNDAIWDARDLVGEAGFGNQTVYTVYLADDGQPKISAVRAQYFYNLKGWYHPFESWRALGEFRTGNSGTFGSIGNYFPYQKFHNFDDIPMSDSAVGTGRSDSSVQSLLNTNPFFNNVTRTSQGKYLWRLKDLVVSSPLAIVGMGAASGRRVSYENNQTDSFTISVISTSGGGTHTVNDADHAITVFRTGKDGKQVDAWNRLSR